MREPVSSRERRTSSWYLELPPSMTASPGSRWAMSSVRTRSTMATGSISQTERGGVSLDARSSRDDAATAPSASAVSSLVHASPHVLPSAYAAAALAAVGFVTVAARRGIPASATYGMLGGLIGAALVAGGFGAIHWGGIRDHRPVGVVGALIGLVVSPVLGLVCGAALRGALTRVLRRGTRRFLRPVRGGIWVAAAFVALSDGANDGQKAMGLAAATLLATGSLDHFRIPLWVRAAAALVLALGTAVGGGRVIRRVGTGYFRPSPIDAL